MPGRRSSQCRSLNKWRAMRSFVTSVPGSRSSPGPVSRSGPVPSALPLRATSPIQRPFAIHDLSGFYPITGRRLMQSFPLSTAGRHRDLLDRQSTSSSRRQPRPPCGRWTCSQRAAKGLILESCEASQASEAFILVIGHRQPVSPRPPPTSTALIGSLGGLLCQSLAQVFNDSAPSTCSCFWGFVSCFVPFLLRR
jgi:hypothetical protein